MTVGGLTVNMSRLLRWVAAAVFSLGYLLLALPGTLYAEQEIEIDGRQFTLSGEVQIGGQAKGFTHGDRISKFEEYQEVHRGFNFDLFQFGLEGKDNPYYLRGSGTKIDRDDQSFDLTFGKYGELMVSFSWDEIPHFFSTGSKSLLTHTGGGNFVFDNAAARQFFTDNDPLSPPAPPDAGDAATATLARQLVDAAPSIDLHLQRRRAKGEILYSLYPGSGLRWNFRFHIDNEDKDGNRALSTGTYEPRLVTGLGDTFRVLGIELPEPLNHQTTQVGVATDFSGEGWVVNLGYDYVNFSNDTSVLRWQNPFNNTDELAPFSVLNRGRFAESQIQLFPDNHSHSVTGSGTVTLPFKTQFTGSLSHTWTFQDDRFLPFTLNTAILATNVPGSPPAATLALPKRSLDGEIRTLTQSYALTNRAITDTTLNLFYRYYDYDNETARIVFPGYAGGPDSFWATLFNDGSPIRSRAQSYTRQNAGLDVSWHALRTLTLKTGYEYEHWDRDDRETDVTEEHIAKAALDFKPLSWLMARASYRYGDRKFRGEYESGLEFFRLRKFDEANRIRNLADVLVQVTPLDALSLAGTFRYLNDDFKDSAFGLKRQHEYSFGFDANYTPLKWMTLYGFYAHDFGKFKMRNISRTGNVDFSPANTWDSSVDDRTQSVGAGLKAALIPNRLTFNVGYNFTRSIGKILTSNPNPIEADFRSGAQAVPFPDTKSQLHHITAMLTYKLNQHVTLGTRYVFERYRLNDFQWDILQPYLFPNTQDNAARFLLLDSRYSNYDVHVLGGFLRVQF